jgi:hypothetical protein
VEIKNHVDVENNFEQISLLPKFFPCFCVAIFCILGIKHVFCIGLLLIHLKGDVPVQKRKIITYRSYKNFDTDSFNCDLENISFPDIENLSTSSEVHNVYNKYHPFIVTEIML